MWPAMKDKSLSQNEEIDSLLVQMIALDAQPFSIVDRLGFQAFVNGLCPSYELPSRSTVTRQFNLEYEKKVEKVSTFSLNTIHICSFLLLVKLHVGHHTRRICGSLGLETIIVLLDIIGLMMSGYFTVSSLIVERWRLSIQVTLTVTVCFFLKISSCSNW
jgi:hypothetical protein